MDITELEKLVKLMNENDLVELELETEGSVVRLKKGMPFPALPSAASPVYLPVGGGAPAPAGGAPPAPSEPAPGTVLIRSPIVGTFYKTPSPDSPPYVSPGDRISAESVVCIIEAMKVMNEIKAEVAGEILEVLVENGQPVEYDQPLFRVKSA